MAWPDLAWPTWPRYVLRRTILAGVELMSAIVVGLVWLIWPIAVLTIRQFGQFVDELSLCSSECFFNTFIKSVFDSKLIREFIELKSNNNNNNISCSLVIHWYKMEFYSLYSKKISEKRRYNFEFIYIHHHRCYFSIFLSFSHPSLYLSPHPSQLNKQLYVFL